MPETSVEFRKDRSLKKGPVHYPFWFGGSASCFAACVTHPLDLVKVRLQTQSHNGPRRNMLQMFSHIFKEYGILGLYKGLSASILRQATYSTTRFGVYEALKERTIRGAEEPSTVVLIGLASFSGFLGGLAGNPADVLNVRMQHDAALPLAERRNYRHAIDGLVRMARDEGVLSLWRGVWPNSFRGVLMTASQLASYDSFKRMLLHNPIPKVIVFEDDLTTHFTASFLAGFVATTVCSPVDVIKTRVMSAKEKHNIVKLTTEIIQQEGLRGCFKGWVPSFIRLGPHTIATFLFLEQHKKLYRRYIGIDEQQYHGPI